MNIKVLYFASLREEIGRASDVLELSEPLSVNAVWTKATQQEAIPDDLLMAINQEYATAEALVNGGDEVAFFPPVTGG